MATTITERIRFFLALPAALTLAFAAGQVAATDFACEFETRVQVGTVAASTFPYLNEASGLVQSRSQPEVFWSHQDNSYDERLFALRSDGTYLGTWDLNVTAARDPEDIAIGPGPIPGQDYIYYGDVGHNAGVWGASSERNLRVWRAVEPSVDPAQPFVAVSNYPAETITLAFPDEYMLGQRQDVEGLMIDPLTGDIYIVTKRSTPGMVFRAPFPHSTTQTIVMEWVANLPFGGDNQATGADISPDGRMIVVRRYPDAYIWQREPGQTIGQAIAGEYCRKTGLSEPQGEAITFDVDNSGSFYTVSEGGGQVPIWLHEVVPSGCVSNTDCDDGSFCSGQETCDSNGDCQAGQPPSCPGQTCNDSVEACVECSANADCDDGSFCNGAETCDASGQCQTGAPPACSGQACSDTVGACVDCLTHAECDDGSFCNGAETCNSSGQCSDGSAPNCGDDVCSDTFAACVECAVSSDCAEDHTCNVAIGQCVANPSLGTLPIGPGTEWRYFKGTSEPPAGWHGLGFADSAWLSGPSGFGYGSDCAAMHQTELDDMQGGYVSVYLRKTFEVADPSSLDTLKLTLDFDDAFVAYLNGIRVASWNIDGTPPANTQQARANRECSESSSLQNPPLTFILNPALLLPGQNVIAIQAHNLSLGSSDFTLMPSLVGTTCSVDAECDDGSFCNGQETCDPSGQCAGGSAPDCGGDVCSDGLAACVECVVNSDCAEDATCDLATGQCVTNPSIDTLPIGPGAEWRYFKGTSEPPADWHGLGFEDSGWLNGLSGFGYGSDCAPMHQTVLGDMKGNYVSVYLRKTFEVADLSNLNALTLTMDFDDSFVAYLNGVQVASWNVVGTPPPNTKLAQADHECSGSNLIANPPSTFALDPALLLPGQNVIAIQGHNLSLGSSDFSLIPSLVGAAVTSTPTATTGAAATVRKRAMQREAARQDPYPVPEWSATRAPVSAPSASSTRTATTGLRVRRTPVPPACAS